MINQNRVNTHTDVLEELGIDPFDNNGSRPVERSSSAAVSPAGNRPKGRAIIVGAGVTGLTTAWQLTSANMDTLVLEASNRVGGMATTFRHNDFLLDQGPHKFFSVMEDRMRLAEQIVGTDDFLVVPKRSRIRLAGHFLNYPLGLLDIVKNLNPLIAVSGGLSYLWQLVKNVVDRRPDISYEDWLVRRFGRKLYELVFAEYARKIWGDPKELARELAETRVAIPGLLPLLWNMLVTGGKGRVIHAETFRYPKLGTGEFSRCLADLVLDGGGEIRYGSALAQIQLKGNQISSLNLASGEEIPIQPNDVVVTTIPIAYLVRLIKPAPPPEVIDATRSLKTWPLVLLYLIVNRESISDDSWLFFPESKYIFTRAFEQKNFSSHMSPKNQTSLCLEIVAIDRDLWRATDEYLYERAIAGLEEMGLVDRSEVDEYFTRRLPWVYPVYDLNYKQNTRVALDYLDGISNLYSVGRQGGFNYVGQIDCLDIGVVTAEQILQRKGKTDWSEARHRFDNYIVLD
jgi:protoporphyrinogen oxidase